MKNIFVCHIIKYNFDKCSLSNSAKVKEWRRSGVFIVNFEQISHLVLAFLLLTLSR